MRFLRSCFGLGLEQRQQLVFIPADGLALGFRQPTGGLHSDTAFTGIQTEALTGQFSK
jgi:hypothetical protein